MGPDHEVNAGAPPVCAAARHVTKAFTQQVRGMSELERQAAKVPTQEAPVVADEGLASRPVRRDEGQSPLEPPGLPRDQQWPRLAAAGERVRVAPPSAVLTRRSRRLAVVPLCHRACAPVVIRCSGMHHRAHR